jgi:Electron transfer DM13
MKKIVITIGVVLVGLLAYYFISPLFIKVVVDDALPVESTAIPTAPIVATSTTTNVPTLNTPPSSVVQKPDTKNTPTAPSVPPAQSPAPGGSVAVAAPVVGTPGHRASGSVRLLATAQEYVVRYENFETINGPDLFVYLATDLQATEFVDLGRLKGTEGNMNYTVPAGVDITKYPYVLVWCKQFGVLFNSAKMN